MSEKTLIYVMGPIRSGSCWIAKLYDPVVDRVIIENQKYIVIKLFKIRRYKL